jgi:hypothetical protein
MEARSVRPLREKRQALMKSVEASLLRIPYPSRHGMRAVSLARSCRIILEKGHSRAPVPEFLPFWQPGKAREQRGEAPGDSSGQNRRPPVDGLRWWSGFSFASLSESNMPGLAKPRPAKPAMPNDTTPYHSLLCTSEPWRPKVDRGECRIHFAPLCGRWP